jgi:hypothetical protein
MPLSRHFYSLDEVQAALLYTTSHNKLTESLFWCQELILSGCIGETISTLFKSWLWNTGPMRLEWLINAWKTLASEEISEDDILLSTYQLTYRINRDNSLWNILVLTAKNPNSMPDTVTRKMPAHYPSLDDKEVYFIRSLYQGKAQSAWWISQYIDSEDVWHLLKWFCENLTLYKEQYTICLEALRGYDRLLGYKSAEYDVIIRCAAVIIMCIHPKKQTESFKPLDMNIDKNNMCYLNEWSTIIGRRDRRIYKIPTSCLYGDTLRGTYKWSQNNLVQLYNVEKYLPGCPFWDEVLEDYATVNEKGIITWFNDDKMENFYEKYFPDDIPDEWSKKDKEMSHGDGILAPNDKPTIYKYSRNFLSRMPCLAWNTSQIVNSYLENVDTDGCSVEQIIRLYKTPIPLSDDKLKMLKPVHKIKII